MTAELATYNGHSPAQPEPALAPATTDLAVWAESARAAANIAVSLAKTSFVPQPFRGKPEEVTAAILTGQEMGLSPMAALRSFDIIQGTPAMRANALRGLVQAHGHEVWVEEETSSRAVVCGRRKGSEQIERSRWTTDRARQMGLLGKDNWKKQPGAMLVARATAEVCRRIAADVLLGVPYAVEDLDEGEAPKPRKVSRRKPEPVAVPEPDIEPPAAEEAGPEGEDDKVANAAVGPDNYEPPLWPEVTQPGGGAE